MLRCLIKRSKQRRWAVYVLTFMWYIIASVINYYDITQFDQYYFYFLNDISNDVPNLWYDCGGNKSRLIILIRIDYTHSSSIEIWISDSLWLVSQLLLTVYFLQRCFLFCNAVWVYLWMWLACDLTLVYRECDVIHSDMMIEFVKAQTSFGVTVWSVNTIRILR